MRHWRHGRAGGRRSVSLCSCQSPGRGSAGVARRLDIPRRAMALACLVVENMAAVVVVSVAGGGVESGGARSWWCRSRFYDPSLEVERGVGESACHDWLTPPAAKVAPSDRLESVKSSINIRLLSVN
jgi:hypothetical protein